MLSIEEIVNRLRTNYEVVVTSLPGGLQEEFRTKVLPLSELEEYASFINTSVEFEGYAARGLTMRKIGRKVTVKAFNNKLIASGITPESVYSALLAGVFESE